MRFAALILLSTALPLTAAASDSGADPATAAAPRPVVTETLEPAPLVSRDIIGTVAASAEADLGFTVAGRLSERPVSAGDLVQAGGVLAVLDPEDLDASLRAAEAQVAQAEAQLAQASDAEERARKLTKRGVASEVQLESATRARISAQSALDQAQAAQAAAADRRASTRLTAPEAGIVTATYAEAGATLTAGQPVLHFATSAGREVVIDLTEAELASLPGSTVFDAALGADPAVTTTARVSRVDPVAERATRTRRVHLSLDTPPPGMRLGALVHVRPHTGVGGWISLPVAAVFDTGAGPQVWFVSESGGIRQVSARTVTLAPPIATPELANAGRIAITEGLAAGDEVVIRGIHSLSEGQPVGPAISR